MNSDIRTTKEMQNLFDDKRNARKAWQAIGKAILQNPAALSAEQFDKDGNRTLQSEVEHYTYLTLANDIAAIAKENNCEPRKPTELEMIMYGQIVKARWDTAAATFVRDTLGAKPVDESKVDASLHNPYEELTDEELEALAKMREDKVRALSASPDDHLVEHVEQGCEQLDMFKVHGSDSLVEATCDDTSHA